MPSSIGTYRWKVSLSPSGTIAVTEDGRRRSIQLPEPEHPAIARWIQFLHPLALQFSYNSYRRETLDLRVRSSGRRREHTMAIGTLRRFVVDVNDLEVGERFWSEVTGLELQFSAWAGQFSALGKIGSGAILLQLVPEPKTKLKNRAHIDVTVDDVGKAVDEVVRLGGSTIKHPGYFPPANPHLEWAVVADPFGNEFCLIRDLDQE